MLILLLGIPAHGALPNDSLGFFTNVASRLLAFELKADPNHIPVHPTNAYAPSVHRLLQITANLYDSSTTNWFPTIFRPTFGVEGTNIFINGFEVVEATNESFFTTPMDLRDPAAALTIATNGRVNVYGVPWIIGVKRGLPNFNELAVTSEYQVSRRLLVEKPAMVSSPTTFGFSQQLVMSLSTEIGVELWNSYSSSLAMEVEALTDCRIRTVLTNRLGGAWTNEWNLSKSEAIPVWSGRGLSVASPNPASFVIPLRTNLLLLQNGVFDSGTGMFFPANAAPFEPVLTPAAQWGLKVETYSRVVIREASTRRVLDYVHLRGPDFFRLLDDDVRTVGYGVAGLWNTNLTAYAPIRPVGVEFQLRISVGDPEVPISDWNNFGINQPAGASRDKAIAEFKAFWYSARMFYNGHVAQNPTNLVVQAPFTPTSKTLFRVEWSARDPLLHHTSVDLVNLEQPSVTELVQPPAVWTNRLPNLGKLNNRYQPWGGNPLKGLTTPADVSFAIKDPQVRSPDNWNFPSGEPLSLSSIGRIHRGTPWQTIYFKSTNGVPLTQQALTEWRIWTGNVSLDATNTVPVRDHSLVDALFRLLQTNDIRQLPSVNAGAAEWLSVMDGLTAVTNSSPEQQITISSNSPQVEAIVLGINQARGAQPFGYFSKLSGILSVPELSCASPFLKIDPGSIHGSSESAMEILPAQLLSLLRPDSAGALALSNGMAQVQFTGIEGCSYRVERSTDLLNWTPVSTNVPVNGTFNALLPASADSAGYFRSVLMSD